jgi:hypothetical protein
LGVVEELTYIVSESFTSAMYRKPIQQLSRVSSFSSELYSSCELWSSVGIPRSAVLSSTSSFFYAVSLPFSLLTIFDCKSSEEQETREQSFKTSLNYIQKKSAFGRTHCFLVFEGVMNELVTEQRIKGELHITDSKLAGRELIRFVNTQAANVLFAIVLWA